MKMTLAKSKRVRTLKEKCVLLMQARKTLMKKTMTKMSLEREVQIHRQIYIHNLIKNSIESVR